MDDPAVQDASAAVEQAKAAPQPDPTPLEDPEWESLQSDAAFLARRAADLQAAYGMIEQQLATGQITDSDAIALKHQYEQRWGEASRAVKSLSEREQAYRKRKAQNDEREVLSSIPQWMDSKTKALEMRQLTDYLANKGMSQEQMAGLSAKAVVKEYGKMKAAIRAKMTQQERMMDDFDTKLQVKQVAEAERSPPPKPAPDESPRVVADITQKDTDEMTGMWAENIKAWESANGRKLSNRERRMACLSGAFPRR